MLSLFQEYFEKLGKDPKRWGKPFSALLGALDAQIDLGVGSIGGKDSMSGSFEDLDVPLPWSPSQFLPVKLIISFLQNLSERVQRLSYYRLPTMNQDYLIKTVFGVF